MIDDQEARTTDDQVRCAADAASSKRPYSAPVLVRLGALQDFTRSVGSRGANDGARTGNRKRTSF